MQFQLSGIIFGKKRYHKKLNYRFYKSVIEPVLLYIFYGAESWPARRTRIMKYWDTRNEILQKDNRKDKKE